MIRKSLCGKGFRAYGRRARNIDPAGKLRRVLAMGILVLTLGGMAGCGRNAPEQKQEDGSLVPLSGSLRVAGSSSMEKLTNILAEGFMEKYPEISVSVQFTGSGAGIESLIEGRVDIGISSRYLDLGEKMEGAVENIIGLDGIAICVDSTNGIAGLTSEQLKDIYRGRIRNWAELGGDSVPIVVIGREAGSGTRSAFEELLGLEEQCAYGNELDSTGAVAARVASTPGAIGYVSFDVAEHTSVRTLKTVSLDGNEPTASNIGTGDYSLYRPFVMATKGEISGKNQLIQAWFEYVYGREGQEAIEAAGVVPVGPGMHLRNWNNSKSKPGPRFIYGRI